jgi:hypothetical protein
MRAEPFCVRNERVQASIFRHIIAAVVTFADDVSMNGAEVARIDASDSDR